ncbi:hypothetical protein FSC37_19375 [Piscinibacter aquaticus]|uniref:Uncharacterized protein n=1 Tax=Piscinibacter aquaticus TaxID=392597 RepID=A0A5C6U2H8_9BURK|nr:hypothetical protein FSC37_19375 [Piscinibacter aquaticus]
MALFPVKLLALWAIHQGQTLPGVLVIVAAKLLGTAFVGRLFILTEPQLTQFALVCRRAGLVAAHQAARARGAGSVGAVAARAGSLAPLAAGVVAGGALRLGAESGRRCGTLRPPTHDLMPCRPASTLTCRWPAPPRSRCPRALRAMCRCCACSPAMR